MEIYTVFHQYPDSYSTMRVRILVEHSVDFDKIRLKKKWLQVKIVHATK